MTAADQTAVAGKTSVYFTLVRGSAIKELATVASRQTG